MRMFWNQAELDSYVLNEAGGSALQQKVLLLEAEEQGHSW